MYESYSVLFVDDEINILSSLRRGLLEEEYNCHFAESAKGAVEILKQKKIQVIITDMRMPETNGLELLKHVDTNYPSIVKIVLSGYTQLPQVLATINQVKIFNFITKPWNIDELIVIIRRALDYFILQEENEKYKTLLETQNLAYQNILKRIDEIVDQAKRSTELLRSICNELLSFGKDFTPLERTLHNKVISMQYEIYQVLSKAITPDRKELSSKLLQHKLSERIQAQFPETVIDKRTTGECCILTNDTMLEAVISSILILFHDEFTQNGLYVNFKSTNKFTISIISRSLDSEAAPRNNDMTVFQTKMAYLKNIIGRICGLCHITLQILDKEDNLAIGFSFDEH